jgi:hypothetical protein
LVSAVYMDRWMVRNIFNTLSIMCLRLRDSAHHIYIHIHPIRLTRSTLMLAGFTPHRFQTGSLDAHIVPSETLHPLLHVHTSPQSHYPSRHRRHRNTIGIKRQQASYLQLISPSATPKHAPLTCSPRPRHVIPCATFMLYRWDVVILSSIFRSHATL